MTVSVGLSVESAHDACTTCSREKRQREFESKLELERHRERERERERERASRERARASAWAHHAPVQVVEDRVAVDDWAEI